MTRKKADEGVHLPNYVPQDGYPEGDGPLWIAQAIGASAGTPIGAAAYRSAEDENTAIVLTIGELALTFRPARLIVTRRLLDVLGSRGFPTPNYAQPQLLLLGQAIGRLAHQAQEQQEERAADELASLVGGWVSDCLRENVSYLLRGRAGADVRAAVSHVRNGYTRGSRTAPLIYEPERDVLAIWSVPVRDLIRDRYGSMHDGDIGLQLQRGGATRERIDARPGPTDKGTVGIPLFVVPNGWQDVEVEKPDGDWECGPYTLTFVRDRSGTNTRAGA